MRVATVQSLDGGDGVTWEVGDEDDLGLVVQSALNLLELGSPRREVHQQGHQPPVGSERRPVGPDDVHAWVEDP